MYGTWACADSGNVVGGPGTNPWQMSRDNCIKSSEFAAYLISAAFQVLHRHLWLMPSEWAAWFSNIAWYWPYFGVDTALDMFWCLLPPVYPTSYHSPELFCFCCSTFYLFLVRVTMELTSLLAPRNMSLRSGQLEPYSCFVHKVETFPEISCVDRGPLTCEPESKKGLLLQQSLWDGVESEDRANMFLWASTEKCREATYTLAIGFWKLCFTAYPKQNRIFRRWINYLFDQVTVPWIVDAVQVWLKLE